MSHLSASSVLSIPSPCMRFTPHAYNLAVFVNVIMSRNSWSQSMRTSNRPPPTQRTPVWGSYFISTIQRLHTELRQVQVKTPSARRGFTVHFIPASIYIWRFIPASPSPFLLFNRQTPQLGPVRRTSRSKGTHEQRDGGSYLIPSWSGDVLGTEAVKRRGRRSGGRGHERLQQAKSVSEGIL